MRVTRRDVFMLVVNGACPFNSWIRGISHVPTRARIRQRIDKLERGLLGDWKSLEEGVFELRLDFGPGYRVYYAQKGATWVILLGGSDKKHQDEKIAEAVRIWKSCRDDKDLEDSLIGWRTRYPEE